jgi:hypothetical protein
MRLAMVELIARVDRAARRVARDTRTHLEQLRDFLRDILLPERSSARPYLLAAVLAAVVLGFAGVRLLSEGGPSGSSAPTDAGAGKSPGASDATPSSGAASPTIEPSPEPTPKLGPPPIDLALRGSIDAGPGEATGLVIGVHEVRLVVDPRGGSIGGTFTIGIEQFGIGALLTRTFGGDDDPAFDAFQACTVTLTLVGAVSGVNDPAAGALSGTAAFNATMDDVDDCLKTRPASVTIDPDKVAQPTTRDWRATFDGTTARGTIDLDPALSFTAVAED